MSSASQLLQQQHHIEVLGSLEIPVHYVAQTPLSHWISHFTTLPPAPLTMAISFMEPCQ